MAHTHDYTLDVFCGARVCAGCDDHMELAHCLRCGWARAGRHEPEQMGDDD